MSFEYRKAIKPGYVEIAGIVRQMAWEDFSDVPSQNPNYLKTTDISKVQFSFKYNFNQTFYKKNDSM